MSNSVELNRRPPIKELLVPNRVVRRTLRERIEAFLKMRKPSFSPHPALKRDHQLFTLEAGEKRTSLIDSTGRIIGEVASIRLQKLGLEVMSLYGLDLNKPESVNSFSLPDRTSTETAIYQGTLIENQDLQFVRQLRRDEAGKMLSVSWFLRYWTP